MHGDMAVRIIEALLILFGGWLATKSATYAESFFKYVKGFKGILDRILKLESKQTLLEKDIQIAKSKQMAFVYTAGDPIFITNTKGEVIFVNPAWLEMTGMATVHDAYGFGYMQAIPLEDRDELREQSETLVEHPGPFSGSIRFRNVRTREIINTMCRSEVVRYDGEAVETVGRLYTVSKEVK